MFHVSNICKNYSFTSHIAVQVRNKAKTHWAKLKKKTSPKYKALNHFDDFYASVFGSKWEPMRQALLRGSKYVAVVNNYGDAEETIEYLTHRGAHCLKNLMKVQQEFHNEYSPKSADPPPINNTNKLQEYVNRVQSEDISSLYPEGADTPDRLSFKDKKPDGNERILHINKSDGEGKQSMNYPTSESQLDESRIIDPSMGMSSEVLYQYIPATKLKGMDEWIPESLHYSYYSTDKDFPLVIEPETEFQIPEHLKVYTYEMDSEYHKFPEPKRCKTGVFNYYPMDCGSVLAVLALCLSPLPVTECSTWVFNYYPMDCGSVLAVLALCLSPGDRVLDLCAAPGGKSLVALQTLLPDIVVCNDTSISRHNRMERIFNDYLFDFKTSNKWRERVLTTRVDGRIYKDDQGFDKVLVDVPCTTDRLSVNEDENNVFRPDRVRERLKLPEMQSQLLTNALRLVRPGGAVVYSTCSLSPVQNDGVVHAALKRAFEEYGVLAAVKDLTIPMSALSSTLLLATGDIAPRYGQLVLPSVSANFGPSYLARLVRIK